MTPSAARPFDTAPAAVAGLPLLAAGALLVNAFVWGVSWWPFRHLQALGLHPLWATTLVYVVALAVIVARWPRALARLSRTPALWIVVLGSGTTNAAFNWAVSVGDVVRVILLFYLMPVWTALLARPVLRERLTRWAVARVLLGLAGAVLVLAPAGAGGASLAWSRLGLPELLGLVGGFSFALNNVMLRHQSHQPAEVRALAMFAGGAAVALALALALDVPAPPPLRAAWAGPAALLALAFLASNLALQYGASRLRANVTALVMLTEIVFAGGSAVWLGDQVITAPMLLGGTLILVAATFGAVSASQPAAAITPPPRQTSPS